jgi:hypothetical protein
LKSMPMCTGSFRSYGQLLTDTRRSEP